MKTYQGIKTFDGGFEIQVVSGGESLPLKPPPGYRRADWSWGADADSPNLTALSLLVDALQDYYRAGQCYEKFAKAVIGKLDGDSGWTMDYYALVAFADANAPPNPVELIP